MPTAKEKTRKTARKAAKAEAKPVGGVSASEHIDRYIEELSDWRGKTLARIRKIFHAADSDIVEEWKWMGSPVWSRDGIVAVGNAHKNKVKLTFQQGAHLPDPQKVFNAGLDGNQWRAIDLFEGNKIDESALKELIRSAVRYNASRGK
jgi:hypothetical protein